VRTKLILNRKTIPVYAHERTLATLKQRNLQLNDIWNELCYNKQDRSHICFFSTLTWRKNRTCVTKGTLATLNQRILQKTSTQVNLHGDRTRRDGPHAWMHIRLLKSLHLRRWNFNLKEEQNMRHERTLATLKQRILHKTATQGNLHGHRTRRDGPTRLDAHLIAQISSSALNRSIQYTIYIPVASHCALTLSASM